MKPFPLCIMVLVSVLVCSCKSSVGAPPADVGKIEANFTATTVAIVQSSVGKVPPPHNWRVHPTAGVHRLDSSMTSQILELEVVNAGNLPRIKKGDRIAFSLADASKLFGVDDPVGRTRRFEVDWDWNKEGVLATDLKVVPNQRIDHHKQ